MHMTCTRTYMYIYILKRVNAACNGSKCTHDSGFSTGFNLAESINFATANWIPYGIQSLKEIRVSRRESVIGAFLSSTHICQCFSFLVYAHTRARHEKTTIVLLLAS